MLRTTSWLMSLTDAAGFCRQLLRGQWIKYAAAGINENTTGIIHVNGWIPHMITGGIRVTK